MILLFCIFQRSSLQNFEPNCFNYRKELKTMIKQVLVKNVKEFNHGGGFRPSDTGGGAISNLFMKWSHSAPRPYETPLGVKNKGG